MNINHSHNLFGGNYVNYDDYRAYTVTWASTAQDTTPQTDGWIANNPLGYWTEFQKVGTEVNVPALPNSSISELRPVTDLSVLLNANEILLRSISFHALDVKKIDSEYQGALTNTAITDSLNSDNNALVQTRFLNSVPPDWQPNFFRPSVIIDNKDILGNFASSSNFGTKNNAGDKSIGLPLPLSYDFNYQFTGVKEIKVFGLCYQYIAETLKYKRYGIICHADFLYK
jgi:hypothetical protein